MQAQKSKATDPWAKMDGIIGATEEPTDPCWFTVSEWAERYKKSECRASFVLNGLSKRGVLVKWTGIGECRRKIAKYRFAK